jgi:hypothetical protein
MRAERALLRIGEYLVGRACRRLPREIRDERYREWAAELPAILRDPGVRPAPCRAARMLFYAADTLRGTALARRRPAPFTSLLGLLFTAGLVLVVWGIRDTVRAPGSWVNYMQVTWSLFLVAWPVSQYVRSAARMTVLIVISGNLAGVVVCAWKAVQAPRDWANYFVAACQFLLVLVVLACWLVSRRVRAGGHDGRALAE